MNTKYCTKCASTKSVAEFQPRGRHRPLQTQAYCKSCRKKETADRARFTRRLVARWKMLKGCARCDFKASHPCQLDIDHIDASTKSRFQVGSRNAYNHTWSKKRLKQELAKCQVLCKNCHAIKTQDNYDFKH